MKLFTCTACGQTLHFENDRCTKCGHVLAYLPDRGVLSAMEAASGGAAEMLVALAPEAKGVRYRPCANGVDHGACNWAVPEAEGDGQPLCRSCRLNDVIPNLTDAAAKTAWRKLEAAKRRLLYTLLGLGLPVETRAERPDGGLAFSFKQDTASEKVFTGHNDGLITINVAEADAPFREKTRQQLGEGYRTLLGHFRHEIGHYYWERLLAGSPRLPAFRALFGDERAEYQAAVQRHYSAGAPADWAQRFVSAYASMHPWEDFAETWAHALHIIDTLDTARSFGLAIRPRPQGGGQPDAAARAPVSARRLDFDDFDDLLAAWVPLTVALNSLNRSMGLPDPYPFVLSRPAIDKLRFVHEMIEESAAGEAAGRRGLHS